MQKDIFDFPLWINDSSLVVVMKALQTLEKIGTTNDHSFYISFVTKHSEVIISDSLLKKYPEVMTIVLEHQFTNLKTTKLGFNVTLYFNGMPESMFIPWTSMIAFNDKLLEIQFIFNPKDKPKTKVHKQPKNSSNIIMFPKKQ